jgi:hypothetical protein
MDRVITGRPLRSLARTMDVDSVPSASGNAVSPTELLNENDALTICLDQNRIFCLIIELEEVQQEAPLVFDG